MWHQPEDYKEGVSSTTSSSSTCSSSSSIDLPVRFRRMEQRCSVEGGKREKGTRYLA